MTSKMTLETRSPRAWFRSLSFSIAASCMLLAAGSAAASAAPVRAGSSTAVPATLRTAAEHSSRADRALVADAKALVACVAANRAHPARCDAARAAVQQAGIKLKRAERHLASVASAHRARATASANRAPRLAVDGDRLTWTRVANVKTYLLVRQVAGQANQYSLVSATAATPAPVPGESVSYAVRTAVGSSSWSRRRTVHYPWSPGTHSTPPSSPSAPSSPPEEVVDTQSAPTISVSGHKLSWSAIKGVSAYVVVSKVQGEAEKFTSVSATSLTPEEVPGSTVHYSVRTAVDGSAWSTEVAISYPAVTPPVTPPPTEPTPPKESPAPTSTGFQFGINSGTNMTLDVGGAAKLGAKIVRIDFGIGETVAMLEPVIAGYAAKGIRVAPLAGFYGSMPTPTEAQDLANWAKAFGPGGSYWAAHGNGQLAIQTIEFGNETSGGYQYGDNAGEPSYQTRAETYAIRLKEAAEAITASGMKVGLLAVSEDWTGDWMNGMFSAVPNLGSYIAGWISHPYGTGWKTKIEDIISQAKAHGASSSIPIDITEWGLSTDNTSCVSENFGFSSCMTYTQAAETLRKSTKEIGALLGSREGLFMLYQVRDQALPGKGTNRETYMGLLQEELQPKGAYTEAAEELLAG
jgi:hypothetical protein